MKINLADNRSRARQQLMYAGIPVSIVNDLDDIGYFKAPASKGHHLAVPGGLAMHSMNVAEELSLIAGQIKPHIQVESLYRIGLLHDLVKCYCYRVSGHDGLGNEIYEYVQPPYPGHGTASAMICSDLGIRLTPEERAAIVWHMGAFGLSEKELKEYRASIKRYPEIILLTHAADHIASINEEKEEEAGNGR